MPKYEIFRWDSGDWEALVKDGVLMVDDHSISSGFLLEEIKKLGCEVVYKEIRTDENYLPSRFNEVRPEHIIEEEV